MALNSKKSVRKNTQLSGVDDVVLNGILSFLEKRSKGSWNGTMTDLQRVLNSAMKENKNLPGSPSSLRVVLNRIVNRLRTRSVSVKFGRTSDHTRTRYVKFTQ